MSHDLGKLLVHSADWKLYSSYRHHFST